MHHITYSDYEGREQTIKIPAAAFDDVIFYTGMLRRYGVEYSHIFWD